MKDLIERQDAIDALADYIRNVDKVIGTGHLSAGDCKDAATSVLEDLPSAQQWIPCSERVPEDGEEVNVTWVITTQSHITISQKIYHSQQQQFITKKNGIGTRVRVRIC